MLKNDRLASVVFVVIFIIVKEKKKTKKIKNEEELEERPPRQRPRVVVSVLVRVLLFIFVFFSVIIYILKKVCRKYAEGMQCITLTLSTYLVLQQLSLFQTNTKPLKPNFKYPKHFSRNKMKLARGNLF